MNDYNHDKLIEDLERLLQDAKDFQFHDHKNTDHAAPKMALVLALSDIIHKAQKGDYDNEF